MLKKSKLGPNGKVTILENDYFKIEGHTLKISQIVFDKHNLKYESLDFEDEPVYTLPPHIMEQLGEALIQMAHINFEQIQETARKEVVRLNTSKNKKK